MTAAAVLPRYDRWLRGTAAVLVGVGHPLFDDVVNEGRIAMWRSVERHGEHAGFMTRSARLRMISVAGGEKAFGGRKVAVRDVRPVTSVEAIADAGGRVPEPPVRDVADAGAWACHRGEIEGALARLSPAEQRAARKVMFDLPRTAADRAAWSSARRKLAVELAHLREMVK